jgi:2-polyprenyl-6-methoxyphenol hydroxylase-like FAD-dependent oxidoreductase
MNGRPVPVVILGAGPTGMAVATLLAQYGVESLVLERWENVYPLPRAVHLDDEIYRTLARLGVAEERARISRPCRGLRLVDRSLRVLAEFGRQARWLCRGRSSAAIVRPDATVLRAGCDLSALCAALPASSAHRAAPVSALG